MSHQKRLARKPKRETRSWQKRNDARSVLQKQHATRIAKEHAEREATAALLGVEAATE